MVEPLSPLKIAAERLSNWASATLEVELQRGKDSHEINSSEDNFIVWIVGLSTGAIGAILSVPRFTGISMSAARVVFLPFVLSVLFGVAYRFALKRLEAANVAVRQYRQTKLIDIKMLSTMPDVQADFGEVLAEYGRFSRGDDPGYVQLFKNMKWWNCLANGFFYIPPVAFFLGVVALVFVALKYWEDTATNPQTAKPVPRVQESKP